MDSNADGAIDAIDVIMSFIHAESREKLNHSLTATVSQIWRLVHKTDADGDGRVTAQEFEAHIKEEKKKEALTQFFRWDRNDDGAVDKEEVTQFFRSKANKKFG